MCKKKAPAKQQKGILDSVKKGQVPWCSCKLGAGVFKPEITFFGEALPKAFMRSLESNALSSCDCVLVMGTSLKVGGSVHEVLKRIAHHSALRGRHVPHVLINREEVALPADLRFDISLLGDADTVAALLWSRLGLEPGDGLAPSESAAAAETDLTTTAVTAQRAFVAEGVFSVDPADSQRAFRISGTQFPSRPSSHFCSSSNCLAFSLCACLFVCVQTKTFSQIPCHLLMFK